MCAIDGSLEEDDNEDCSIGTDTQMNRSGPTGEISGSIGGGSQSMSMDIGRVVASRLINIANKLDKEEQYDDADHIDEIIQKLIESLDQKKIEQKQNSLEQQDDEDVVARSNGRVGTGVTDNPNCGMGQGLSDYYFYHGSGSIENNA